MKILYAPSIREFSDNIIANLQVMFDRQILETLMGEGREILYLPHKRTDKRIKDNILRGGGHLLELSEFPKDDVDLLVTDVSSIAFKYSLYWECPSIFTLMGFTKIEFPKDKFYSLLENIGICVYSLKELREVVANFDEISRQKSLKIKEFLEGEII